MKTKPTSCKGCPLFGTGHGFSDPTGSLKHSVVMVGEALGEEEELLGRPFVGKAGKQLRRMVERLQDPLTGGKFSLDDFTLLNVLQCRPPNNVLSGAPYEEEAIRHCSQYLDKQLEELKPRAIVALGNQPMRRLTGHWGIDQLRGYYFDTPYGLVIPTYHPSYIMRGKFELTRIFQLDLLKAVQAARGKRFSRERKYLLHPSPQDVESLIRELECQPDLPVAFDIETPYGDLDSERDDDFVAIEDTPSYTILRISFSHREGWAITMPWMRPFPDLVARLMALPNPKVSWNGLTFDIPRLEANGIRVVGDHFDGMLMWHALEPSLPKGLKYVSTVYCPDMPPWKLSASSNPEWYNAADSDVTICCYNGIKKKLQDQGRWEMYLKHFVEVDKVLREMSRVGVRVDPAQRAAKREMFERHLEEEVKDLQPMVPEAIRPRKVFLLSTDRLVASGKMPHISETAHARDWRIIETEYTLKENEEVVDGWVRRKPREQKAKAPSARKRKKGDLDSLQLSSGDLKDHP